jgi:ZIP family zinc transporter/zinc and cadmium transporter
VPPQLLNTIFYATLAAAATLVGIYMLLHRERWARGHTVHFISFSAGVVLAVAFTHLLPEAVRISDGGGGATVFTIVLVTILSFYILEHTIGIHTCKEGDCDVHSMGVPAFVGVALHSLLDGVVIGTGFGVSVEVGVAATAGVLLHEIPEGITITSLLLHAGYSRARTLVMGWVVALATPVGALFAYYFLRDSEPQVIGVLLALGAGSFIYVGASDLLPETHKKFSLANIVLVLVGVILVYIVAYTIGGNGH